MEIKTEISQQFLITVISVYNENSKYSGKSTIGDIQDAQNI